MSLIDKMLFGILKIKHSHIFALTYLIQKIVFAPKYLAFLLLNPVLGIVVGI